MSRLATHLRFHRCFLAKHTRKHVTVALSGDAGDETFLGYNQYQRMAGLSRIFWLPEKVRKAIASLGEVVPHDKWRQRIAEGVGLKDAGALHYRKMTQLTDDWIVDRTLGENKENYAWLEGSAPLLERLSRYDLKTYLLDDINVKVDRATMAFSLEARAPLEDHRVVEFGLSLPTEYKFQNGIKKKILRDVLEGYLPRSAFERPKTGFGMPLDVWFRTRLKDYVQDTLSPARLRLIPNIHPEKVSGMLERHLSEKENNMTDLWSLVVVSQWLDAHSQGTV